MRLNVKLFVYKSITEINTSCDTVASKILNIICIKFSFYTETRQNIFNLSPLWSTLIRSWNYSYECYSDFAELLYWTKFYN